MLTYIPTDHYWTIAADAERVYSSARRAYVPLDDAGYQAWLGRGWTSAVAMPSEAALWALLAAQAPQCLPDDQQPVPTISKAQALLWLLQHGKSEADIDALIAVIPDAEQRAVAEIEWRYRQPFHHDHPLFAALAPAIGIAVDDLPAAFRAAALL